MNRFEAMKDMGWSPGNPCFGCGASCCENAFIPVTAEEHSRLFPDQELQAEAQSGAGIVTVKPCPHLENKQCSVKREERPEACKRFPSSPIQVPSYCRFPADADTARAWYRDQIQIALSFTP